MGNVNCLRCRFRHEDNGNCTAAGGFCTAVTAAHCPLLCQYLDTGLTPEEIDMDHEAAEQLRQLCQGCDLDRLEKLAEADKDGRLFILPLEPGRSMLYQEDFERPWVMKNVVPCIQYQSNGGIVFYMGYNVFRGRVERGKILPSCRREKKHWRR